MMTFNLREQQTRLQARMDELRSEMAFAETGENRGLIVPAGCVKVADIAKNMANITRIFWCGGIVMARTERKFHTALTA